MCQGLCSMGFSFDHRNLKTSALDVERSFTCCHLVELWQDIMNLKNEVDKENQLGYLLRSFIPQATSFCALRIQVV